MKTRKPFSTISYNTNEFLELVLNRYAMEGKLQFWAYINHLPDTDDTKDHKHVFLVPSKPIETQNFLQDMIEPCSDSLPLGCTWVQPSDFENWYLYSIHDEHYLRYKHLEKKNHYTWEDVKHCDLNMGSNYFIHLINEIDMSKYSSYWDIVMAFDMKRKKDFLVRSGLFNLRDIQRAKAVWDILEDSRWD